MTPEALTPQQILERLDAYVVGQDRAKRAVAVALRNRWRRRQLDPQLASDVYPKNILLIGPTGVGKTEIARRLADLARAPFVKVEASKYSEVGYHGRDVESMVRDLMESAVALVRREQAERVRDDAKRLAEERLFDAVLRERGLADVDLDEELPFAGPGGQIWKPDDEEGDDNIATTPEQFAQIEQLRRGFDAGELDEELLDIEVEDTGASNLSITGPQGLEAMGIDAKGLQELWGRTPMTSTRVRKLTVRAARDILVSEESNKLLDEDTVHQEALQRAENDGIVFIDEIDKVVGGGGGSGPDVSREGVQRDLLPIVEGCAVYTRYGHVRTDHMLFLAAGAFHMHKPSELIPELQGRFPVRVALRPLTEADFVRILTEPRNSLTKQYEALFATEGVELSFTKDGVQRLAAVAFAANRVTQNIGARRLMTVLEQCLEELSFDASERSGDRVVVDEDLVQRVLGDQADDEDLIRYDM